MDDSKIAKLLLQGYDCNKCRILNPYDWPQVWCRHNHNKPELLICEKFELHPQYVHNKIMSNIWKNRH